MIEALIPLLKQLILSSLRKVVFGSGVIGLFIANMIKSGQITEGDVNSTIVFIVSLILTIIPLLWSFIRDLVKTKASLSNIKASVSGKRSK